MKIGTLINIDKTLGRFVATLINWVMRLFWWTRKKQNITDTRLKSIAVAKYKGLGSILHTIPLIQSLRNTYPNTKLVFITTKANKEILDTLSIVDATILLDDKNFKSLVKTFPKFLFTIIKQKINLYIDLEIYSSFSSIVTALSMTKFRVGFYKRSENYRFGIYTHMMFYNLNAPVSQTYLQIARLLNCTIETEPLRISTDDFLPLSTTQIKPYILINPNASDLRLERRWPKESFISLIEHLLANFPNYNICLMGAQNEASYVNSIYSAFQNNSRLFSFAGKTNLKELISLISGAELLISNDTGPVHLASILNKKTIAMFGPCSPVHYSYPETVNVIYKKVYCSPCVHEFDIPPCKGNNICMKSINVDEVLKMLQNVLIKGQPTKLVNHPQDDFIFIQNGYVAGFLKI